MAVTVKWIKDPVLESQLKKLGIPFTTGQFAVDDIDVELSRQHNTRLGEKLDQNRAISIGMSMEQGTPIPMVVLNKVGKKRAWVVSGNHRIAGNQVGPGDKDIEAYMIEVHDARVVDILSRVVNVPVGGGFSREERIINAAYLVDTHSVPINEACDLMGAKYEWLTAYVRAQQVRKSIAESGVHVNGLSNSMLIRLSPLREDKQVLSNTARFITEHKISIEEADQVIKQIRAADSHNQKLGVLGTWERIVQERRRPTATKVPYSQKVRAQLLRHLQAAAQIVDDNPTLERLQIIERADQEMALSYLARVSKLVDMISDKSPAKKGVR